MLIVYRGTALKEVCEVQFNRMKAAEPNAVELVIYRKETFVRTNVGNHYIISKKIAKRVEGLDANGSEFNEHVDKTDG